MLSVRERAFDSVQPPKSHRKEQAVGQIAILWAAQISQIWDKVPFLSWFDKNSPNDTCKWRRGQNASSSMQDHEFMDTLSKFPSVNQRNVFYTLLQYNRSWPSSAIKS